MHALQLQLPYTRLYTIIITTITTARTVIRRVHEYIIPTFIWYGSNHPFVVSMLKGGRVMASVLAHTAHDIEAH